MKGIIYDHQGVIINDLGVSGETPRAGNRVQGWEWPADHSLCRSGDSCEGWHCWAFFFFLTRALVFITQDKFLEMWVTRNLT